MATNADALDLDADALHESSWEHQCKWDPSVISSSLDSCYRHTCDDVDDLHCCFATEEKSKKC